MNFWSSPTWRLTFLLCMASCMNTPTCHVTQGDAHAPRFHYGRLSKSGNFPGRWDTLDSAWLSYVMQSSCDKSEGRIWLTALLWWLKRSPEQWLVSGAARNSSTKHRYMHPSDSWRTNCTFLNTMALMAGRWKFRKASASRHFLFALQSPPSYAAKYVPRRYFQTEYEMNYIVNIP